MNMILKAKLTGWSAGRPVVILNNDTASKINIHLDDRIIIKKNSKSTIAVVDLSKSVKPKRISVSQEIVSRLRIKNNTKLKIELTSKPISTQYIHKKLKGQELTKKEIYNIIKDIINNALTESEIAYFVSGIYKNKMNLKEITYLTKAIVKTGNSLKLKNKNIVDKHCIGGIAGNKTTPIIVSICAVAGLIMPKTSSRAITSAAGTADVIETIAKVDFSISELKKIVKETNACMVWGGGLKMAPADDKIIQVERLLNLDPEPQLLASIMAKKISAGSKYVLIDIPYGEGAKVSKQQAEHLSKKFYALAKKFKIKIKVVLTDGSQPIGNGIGCLYAMKDIVSILKKEEDAPKDLRKKSIFLAGQIFELVGKTKKNRGKKLAEEILSSGKAFEKFKQIIKAQKGSLKKLEKIPKAKFSKTITASRKLKIKHIDNKKINFLARIAGSPADKSAGLYLWKHVGKSIKRGEKILTIYSMSKKKLRDSVDYYIKNKPIKFK